MDLKIQRDFLLPTDHGPKPGLTLEAGPAGSLLFFSRAPLAS
jgi:hypothetical protein